MERLENGSNANRICLQGKGYMKEMNGGENGFEGSWMSPWVWWGAIGFDCYKFMKSLEVECFLLLYKA